MFPTVSGVAPQLRFCFLSSASSLSYLAAAAIALSTQMGESHAQDAQAPAALNVQVGDVVVPGEGDDRGETSRPVLQAQNKPRSIVVVDEKTLERENINRVDELQQKIPNYRANNGGTQQSSRQTIRWIGIGASGTGVGTESPTGYVVDNVFWRYWGFQWMDLFDLRSFEVAYGPQGTAGGKNTAAGSLIINNRLPSFTQQATIETNFANYDRVIEKVSVTGPIIDDALAYRVSFFMDKGDGWIRDQVSGAGYKNTDRWGVRGQLLYVGDEITDRLIFNYSTSHEYNGYNSAPYSDSFNIFANGTRPSSTYVQNVWRRLGKPILSLDPYKPSIARMGVDPVRTITVSNELNVGVGENIFTSISAYGFNRNEMRYFEDTQLLELWRGGMDTYVGQASQDFRLTSPKDRDLEWTAGVFLFYDDASNQMHHTVFGSDAAKFLSRPAALPGVGVWDYTKARAFQAAAYAQATYHVDEQLALTLGLRNSYEIRQGSVSQLNRYYPTVSAFDQDQAVIAAGSRGMSDTGGRTQKLNFVTGVFNPQYKLNDNLLLFGLVGRAEKAGAVNTSANPRYTLKNGVYTFNSFPTVITKPETSWDYEIGFKSNWLDNHFLFNATFYWNDFYNFQTNVVDGDSRDQDGTPLGLTTLGNAEHARIRGIELDGRWSPIERLWITFNAAFSDARWVSWPDAGAPSDWAWSSGNVAAPKSLSLSNTRWQGVPLWTFNIGANYEQPLGAVLAGVGGFGSFDDWTSKPLTAFGYFNVNWQDKTQLTNPWSVLQYWQGSYAIVNVGVGIRTDDDKYSLSFWAKNIGDERPFNSWDAGTATVPARVGLTRWPATFGGAFRVKLY
ncbi:TonB-dependent receptor [Methylosinus sp. PW1]|uniref:TonB-dependent receptor n=1 Tax=Methylosinus sp. PW1 TaxID=107636 RepID=UPI000A037FC3|nr:TonB-dependent receptor [Methylosinus sp. PW1]